MADEEKTKLWLPDGIRRTMAKEMPKVRLSEGLTIATLPIVAYLMVFVYEIGYGRVFGIPAEFIVFDLTRFFIALFSVVSASATLFNFVNIVVMAWYAYDNLVARKLIEVVAVLLIIAAHAYLWRDDSSAVLLFLTTMSGFAFLELVFPLITQRGKGKYSDKLVAQDRIEASTDGLIGKAIQVFGGRFVLVLLFLILSYTFSYSVGRSNAVHRHKFLVAGTSPEMVVLRVYGGKMICAPFNRSSAEINQSFVVLKTAEDPDLMLTLEEVGPLSSVETISGQTPSPTPIPTPTLTLSPTSTLTHTLTPSPKSP